MVLSNMCDMIIKKINIYNDYETQRDLNMSLKCILDMPLVAK